MGAYSGADIYYGIELSEEDLDRLGWGGEDGQYEAYNSLSEGPLELIIVGDSTAGYDEEVHLLVLKDERLRVSVSSSDGYVKHFRNLLRVEAYDEDEIYELRKILDKLGLVDKWKAESSLILAASYG